MNIKFFILFPIVPLKDLSSMCLFYFVVILWFLSLSVIFYELSVVLGLHLLFPTYSIGFFCNIEKYFFSQLVIIYKFFKILIDILYIRVIFTSFLMFSFRNFNFFCSVMTLAFTLLYITYLLVHILIRFSWNLLSSN